MGPAVVVVIRTLQVIKSVRAHQTQSQIHLPRMGEPKRPKVQTDASNTCTHTQSVAKELRRSTNKSECISTHQNNRKKPNSPSRSPESRIKEPQRPGNHADALGRCTHAQSGRIDAKTAVKIAENISKSRNCQTHLLAQKLGA